MNRFKGKEFVMTFDTISAGIGEMVQKIDIDMMNVTLDLYGDDYFDKLIYNGEGSNIAYAYIHPCDEMRNTKNFNRIQRAFINAYV